MIGLCTGDPDFEAEGGQFIVTIPSGEDSVQMALTLHQTTLLSFRMRKLIEATHDAQQLAQTEAVNPIGPARAKRIKRSRAKTK